ncbi:MAG: aldo/keto reductase, partial [Chthoniobacterales bacterium]
DIEQDLLGAARETGVGVVAFSVLAQGLLSTKYLASIPESSRAARAWEPARKEKITPALGQKVRQLDEMAQRRGQTLPQMAIAWTLRQPEVTTALMGVSDPDQLEENMKSLEKVTFDPEELQQIDTILRA